MAETSESGPPPPPPTPPLPAPDAAVPMDPDEPVSNEDVAASDGLAAVASGPPAEDESAGEDAAAPTVQAAAPPPPPPGSGIRPPSASRSATATRRSSIGPGAASPAAAAAAAASTTAAKEVRARATSAVTAARSTSTPRQVLRGAKSPAVGAAAATGAASASSTATAATASTAGTATKPSTLTRNSSKDSPAAGATAAAAAGTAPRASSRTRTSVGGTSSRLSVGTASPIVSANSPHPSSAGSAKATPTAAGPASPRKTSTAAVEHPASAAEGAIPPGGEASVADSPDSSMMESVSDDDDATSPVEPVPVPEPVAEQKAVEEAPVRRARDRESAPPEPGNVTVACRIRPLNTLELSQNSPVCATCDASGRSIILDFDGRNTFNFDRVFPPDCTQEEVYNYVAKPVIAGLFDGYNGTLFAYGQTGAGKTHTMEGLIDDPELRGIIPRMVDTVFDEISCADEGVEFTVKVGMVEIYQERIRDLITPSKDNLPVHEKNGSVYVDGLTEVFVTEADHIYNVIKTGAKSRAVASTRMNNQSSRSHSVFILSIHQKNVATGATKSGTLYLVDLAGSEKVQKTHAAGQQLEEAKKINLSLSSLGNVINALTDGKSTHIPYRDSKLTRMLQESLGGNSRTALIINVSPAAYNAPETLSTIRFGVRAKSVRNKPVVNKERSVEELKLLLSLRDKEIDRLRAYIAELEGGGASAGSGRSAGGRRAVSLGGSSGSSAEVARRAFQEEQRRNEVEAQLSELMERYATTQAQLEQAAMEASQFTNARLAHEALEDRIRELDDEIQAQQLALQASERKRQDLELLQNQTSEAKLLLESELKLLASSLTSSLQAPAAGGAKDKHENWMDQAPTTLPSPDTMRSPAAANLATAVGTALSTLSTVFRGALRVRDTQTSKIMADLDTAQHSIARLTRDVAEVTRERDTIASDRLKLSEKLAHMEAQHSEAKELAEGLQDGLLQEQTKRAVVESETTRQLASLQEAAASAQSRVRSLESSIEDMERRLRVRDADVAEVNGRLAQTQEQLDAATAEVSRLKVRYNALVQDSIQAQTEATSKVYQEWSVKYAALEKELHDSHIKHQELLSDAIARERSVWLEESEAQGEAAKSELWERMEIQRRADIQTAVADATAPLKAEIQRNQAAHETTMHALQEQLVKAETAAKAHVEHMEFKENMINDLQAELDALQSTQSASTVRIQTLESSIKQLQMQLEAERQQTTTASSPSSGSSWWRFSGSKAQAEATSRRNLQDAERRQSAGAASPAGSTPLISIDVLWPAYESLVRQMEGMEKSMSAEVSSTKKQLEDRIQKVVTLQEQLDEAQERILIMSGQADERLKVMEGQHKMAVQRATVLEETVTELRADIEKLNAEKARLQETNRRLQEDRERERDRERDRSRSVIAPAPSAEHGVLRGGGRSRGNSVLSPVLTRVDSRSQTSFFPAHSSPLANEVSTVSEDANTRPGLTAIAEDSSQSEVSTPGRTR